MRIHNGMRPQDIAILLKIIAKRGDLWQNKDLAAELFLSPAEISLSLERSSIAGLLNADKKKVHKQTFMDFIQHGLHVVFPVIPGGIVNGLYTAHSHPFMQSHFPSNEAYVWPDVTGMDRGQAIVPLYKDVVKAAKSDADLYKMLAILDIVRVGKVRELNLGIEELNKLINEPSHQHS
jgi:hypothetical protein